jgi:signal transduction histidine kinase
MTKLSHALRRLLTRRPSGECYQRVVVVWLTLSLASVLLAAANWARLSRQMNAATRAVAIRLEVDATFRNQLARASLTSLAAGILGLGAGVFALALSRLTVKHQERERELVQAKLQADRRSQEKTVLLDNMSHELRTPMNAILGFGELMEDDLLNQKQHAYLHFIRRSASSLLQLINDTLDMSKIEAGMLELHPEPTDPREIGQFIQTMFSEPADRKHVHLSCKIAEDMPRSLLLDGARLRQILVNLVGNAIKFTDQGSIAWHLRWEDQAPGQSGTLVIEVQDTGVGIPGERLETIFHPFVQAGAHPEKERQGTGLGLAIVKHLAEMMGGSVTVTSELAQGTLFRLLLPDVAISDFMPAADRLMSAKAPNFNRLRPATVLGVDDNETNRQLLRAMLGDSHHRLLLAGSGAEAIELARTFRPDIILLDIRMPGMDGYRVREALRNIPALQQVPVIALSAAGLVEEETHGELGFDGYMGKPFSRQSLFDELARFLPRLSQASATSNQEILSEQEAFSAQTRSSWSSNPPADDWASQAEAKNLRHDLRSSLAGVVMSAELLLDQIAVVNDTPSALLVTKILAPSLRLLETVKGRRSRIPSVAGETAETEDWFPFPVDGSTVLVERMQTDARELCRRMARLTHAPSVQLSENILQCCLQLTNLAERCAAHQAAAKQDRSVTCQRFPASPGRRQPSDRRPLSLFNPFLPIHGLPGH